MPPNIKTVLYNSDFTVITAVPYEESPFCAAMSRIPAMCEKCQTCTQNSLQLCREQNRRIIYHCHAGLIEAVAPIRMQDIIVGYIMLGQVLQENFDKEELVRYAAPFIGETARELVEELHGKSDADIRAATRLMESCVCYLLMNKFIHQENGNLLLELCQYIEQNPTADLSAAALCARFDINRNYLYRIANTYLGMLIARYVRNKRLRYAQNLIQEGYSVSLAAERAGFCDYGYFGKIFKRYIGKTPSQTKRTAE